MLKAVFIPATGASVILADNSGGRGTSEKILEAWVPSFRQNVQNEPLARSRVPFVNSLKNIQITGRLRFARAFADNAALAQWINTIGYSCMGLGKLVITYLNGAQFTLLNAVYTDFSPAEVLEVRVIVDMTWVGSELIAG